MYVCGGISYKKGRRGSNCNQRLSAVTKRVGGGQIVTGTHPQLQKGLEGPNCNWHPSAVTKRVGGDQIVTDRRR